MKRILLLSLLLALSLTASAQNRPQGGGGAIVLVAALPAACTPNVTKPVVYQGKVYQCTALNTWTAYSTGASSGDVVGPASSTDNAVARFDLATGKLLQNSVVLIGDTGNITGVGTLASGAQTITSAANPCWQVGPNGATNPSLSVDCSPASAATGVKVTPAASGGGVTIAGTGSGNNNITIAPTGTGGLFVTTAIYSGAYAGAAKTTGDIVARRSATTGAYYWGENANAYLYFDGSVLNVGNAMPTLQLNATTAHLQFSSDTGLQRLSAGVLRGTNGSTGAGQLLLGTSTDTADAQLSVYSQSTTRPSLKLNMPSGTPSTQETFGVYNNGTLNSYFRADGTVSYTGTSNVRPVIVASGANYAGLLTNNSGYSWIIEGASGNALMGISLTQTVLNSTSLLGWGSSSILTPDIFLARDAANTLAQRNGANAQNFSVYGTYTDASNYERLRITVNSTAVNISAEKSGTGAARPIRFGVNGAQPWEISTSGHFLAVTDNAYDIGASGATRPRNGYFSGDVTAANFTSTGGNGVTVASGAEYIFTSRGRIAAASDGVILMRNNAATDFSRLQFGGTSSSFPSIKRNGAGLDFRLADDSGYATITAGSGIFGTAGGVTLNNYVNIGTGNLLNWIARSIVASPADGVLTISNQAQSDFSRLQLGGTTNSFPALKRSSATLQVRLADDSGPAAFQSNIVQSTKTSNYTVTASDTGTAFDNIGAGAGVTFTLPTPAAGLNYRVCRVANQTVTLDITGSEIIQIGASATTAGGNVTLDAVGSCAHIWAVSSTQWFGLLSGAATFN